MKQTGKKEEDKFQSLDSGANTEKGSADIGPDDKRLSRQIIIISCFHLPAKRLSVTAAEPSQRLSELRVTRENNISQHLCYIRRLQHLTAVPHQRRG